MFQGLLSDMLLVDHQIGATRVKHFKSDPEPFLIIAVIGCQFPEMEIWVASFIQYFLLPVGWTPNYVHK